MARPESEPTFHEYMAWDAPTRWFHWINVLAVLGLIATGLMILTGGQLGLSPEGKVALKSVHVIFGYVMATNLLWRFVWAFFGNRYARWRAILPGGPGFGAAVRHYAFYLGSTVQGFRDELQNYDTSKVRSVFNRKVPYRPPSCASL